jgi:hypothetical protein
MKSNIAATLDRLLAQETRVLEHWADRKKRLDQCQQFVLLERSAQQALKWIRETGELYLSTHTHVGNSRAETEQLLKEHNEFKGTAKVNTHTHLQLRSSSPDVGICRSAGNQGASEAAEAAGRQPGRAGTLPCQLHQAVGFGRRQPIQGLQRAHG